MAQSQPSRTNWAPSSGLASLVDAYQKPRGQYITVMGIVTDLMQAKETSTGDWMLTCTIKDPDLDQVHTDYNGIKFRAFYNRESELPQVKASGDVILLRNIKHVAPFLEVAYSCLLLLETTLLRPLPVVTLTSPAHYLQETEANPTAYIFTFDRCHRLPLYTFVDENIQATRNAGQPLLVTEKRRSSYVVFPGDSFSISGNPTYSKHMESTHFPNDAASAPSDQEQMMAFSLKQQISLQGADTMTMSARPTEQQTPHSRSLRKFTLIKDAAPDKFYDVVVEIVKIFPGQYDYAELYVTDYTVNPFLYNYPSPDEKDDGISRDGDVYGYSAPMSKREWPGPYGSMTLKIEVREPHASVLHDKMKEGNLINIQNLRIKMGREGKMEGNLWADNKFRDKILLHHYAHEDDSKVQELEKRKSEYWLQQKKSAMQQNGETKQLSKGQKKKRKEREKKAAASEPAAKRIKLASDSKSGLFINSHVHCLKTEEGFQPSSLSQILAADRTYTHPNGEKQTLPFVNQKRKAIVRVVDFYPPTLEEFCTFVHKPQNREGDSSGVEHTTQRWEWCFTLLVESATLPGTDALDNGPLMWVQVNHQDAEYMLKLDATNLKSDGTTLAQLKEQLAILWGNLEERKAEQQQLTENDVSKTSEMTKDPIGAAVDPQLSNLPFECCIKEYGVKIAEEDKAHISDKLDWVQVFGIFGITIV